MVLQKTGGQMFTHFADTNQKTVWLAKVIFKIVISSLSSNRLLLKLP